MREVTGDLWTYPADIRVITTNGTVKKNGDCVMGRGCAAEAKEKYPDLPSFLGGFIKKHGNVVGIHHFDHTKPYGDPQTIISFPVKHEWYQKADLELIQRSAHDLVANIDNGPFAPDIKVLMPRPGCGNGHLDWGTVKKSIEMILDNRFHVITWR